MKSSRLYESLIILLIIVLFCSVVVANDADFIEVTKSFQKPHKVESLISIQIDHSELRIGPMEGCCVIIYSIHSKFHNFSRVTTTDNLSKSHSLAPTEVFVSNQFKDGIRYTLNRQKSDCPIQYRNLSDRVREKVI